MKYQKIDTCFKRDSHNVIIPTEYTRDEFKYLENNIFECTEKIDGTNMRIEISENFEIRYAGKTDTANIPTHLMNKMKELFDHINWQELFPEWVGVPVTIYGEGYGAKIQKGGNYIKNDVNFILFDVKVGNWWLQRKALEEIASKLNIMIVPLIGYMSLLEAIEYVKKGFKSTIAENKNYDAEGLVLKTPNGLLLRNGERLITKIKTVDFIKYNRTH